jgi:hypothetical protein
MGLDLPPEAVTTLERCTEGWIAGLQLAALALQGGTDASAFVTAFSGTHRYVLDYLSDEVLARQPTPVQEFLLHTAILERLSGSLCDAVTGQAVRHCWKGWSAQICLWSPSTTSEAGTAITTCLPRCCAVTCGRENPHWFPNCTNVLAPGTSNMICLPKWSHSLSASVRCCGCWLMGLMVGEKAQGVYHTARRNR